MFFFPFLSSSIEEGSYRGGKELANQVVGIELDGLVSMLLELD